MGVSVRPQIIVGVPTSLIVSFRECVEEYEVHDKKGRPTGIMDRETTKTLHAIVDGVEKKQNIPEYFTEEIADFLGLEEYPKKGTFGLHITNYEMSDVINNSIVGISLLEMEDVMYSGNEVLDISHQLISETSHLVKHQVKEMYDVDYEPLVYLVANAH